MSLHLGLGFIKKTAQAEHSQVRKRRISNSLCEEGFL
jgi:hypothetical protein